MEINDNGRHFVKVDYKKFLIWCAGVKLNMNSNCSLLYCNLLNFQKIAAVCSCFM